MKIRLFAFLTLFSFTLFGQYSAYQKGWDSGWCKGYLETKTNYVCPPAPPAPPAEPFKSTYDDGFARGYSTALSGSNSSSGGNSALIEGERKMRASGQVNAGEAFGNALASSLSASQQPAQKRTSYIKGRKDKLIFYNSYNQHKSGIKYVIVNIVTPANRRKGPVYSSVKRQIKYDLSNTEYKVFYGGTLAKYHANKFPDQTVYLDISMTSTVGRVLKETEYRTTFRLNQELDIKLRKSNGQIIYQASLENIESKDWFDDIF